MPGNAALGKEKCNAAPRITKHQTFESKGGVCAQRLELEVCRYKKAIVEGQHVDCLLDSVEQTSICKLQGQFVFYFHGHLTRGR